MRALIAAGLVLACGSRAALGQAGWIIETEYAPGYTSVNPLAPTARVRLVAYFAPSDYAVAGYNVNVHGTEPGWSNNIGLPPFVHGYGVIHGPSVTGIVGGQLNFPPANIFADPSNPAPVWQADWTATDFRRRSVPLRTTTGRFDVYPERNSPNSTSRLSTVVEGAEHILVTPAPATAAVLAAAAGATIRRKRGGR